jgi:hypothetical protein
VRTGGGEEGVGSRLAPQTLPRGGDAVDPDVDQIGEPGGGDDLFPVGRGGDHGRRQPGVLDRPQVGHRAGVDLDAVLGQLGEHLLVLARGDALDGRSVRRVAGRTLRQRDPPAGQEGTDAVLAALAVDETVVVELAELRRPGLVGPQEFVEGALPRGHVHRRSPGEDAVEVEEAGTNGVREAERPASWHGATLPVAAGARVGRAPVA